MGVTFGVVQALALFSDSFLLFALSKTFFIWLNLDKKISFSDLLLSILFSIFVLFSFSLLKFLFSSFSLSLNLELWGNSILDSFFLKLNLLKKLVLGCYYSWHAKIFFFVLRAGNFSGL